MARRAGKKEKINTKGKSSVSLAAEQIPSVNSGKSSDGVPYVKLLAFIVVVLAFLYGPALFKKQTAVFQAPSKFFMVKKVAQFSGNDIQSGPFFANDIVAVNQHQLAITDNLGAQVILCDFKGKLIHKWGKNGSGAKEFNEPSGITTDHKGHLFVLDTLNGAIKTFDLEGKPEGSMSLTSFGYFSTPRRLGWDGKNYLITNAADARLARLSPKGELLGTWGEKGMGKGGLWGASKAIFDGKSRYYIGDSNLKDSRVRVYDGSGTVVQEIKTGVPSDGLALDSKGRLFVVSYGDTAKVFDPNGNWLGCLADEDQPNVPLNLLTGIDILSDGTILTCGANTITIYRLDDEKEK